MGAQGASYQAANRVFSMVILQVHLALLWGAFSKRYKGYGIGGAITVGLLIALVSQVLILLGTAGSYVMHAETFFNYREALNVSAPVGFSQAIKIRLGGLVVNCVISTVAAVLGYALAFLVPPKEQTA